MFLLRLSGASSPSSSRRSRAKGPQLASGQDYGSQGVGKTLCQSSTSSLTPLSPTPHDTLRLQLPTPVFPLQPFSALTI
jgi:hypothetical protein